MMTSITIILSLLLILVVVAFVALVKAVSAIDEYCDGEDRQEADDDDGKGGCMKIEERWRNGKRAGLENRSPKGRVGSSPTLSAR